jgi:mRNA-degrading endonuclease HigB of HigAB toxin-antitoxin module
MRDQQLRQYFRQHPQAEQEFVAWRARAEKLAAENPAEYWRRCREGVPI